MKFLVFRKLNDSELEKPFKEDNAFGIDSFINSLSTNRFGKVFGLHACRRRTTSFLKIFVSLRLLRFMLLMFSIKGEKFVIFRRPKNVWESPKDCLLFSFTLQMEDGRVMPQIQYVVSLAVTEAIKDVCDRNGLPYVDVRIKWPNDIYLNGLNVGGILFTSTYKLKKFNVSAGIGLNFEKLYDLFIHQGFQSLEELYYKTWLHSGQRFIVQEKNDDQVVESVVTVQGLTSTRYLLAIGDDNQKCELHPDGNSFDFFKGLVRRKLD
ncbi:hypothetical protein M0R45_009522 [Rubus argutus]|uniref:BPL/LPL catalytic domain-containing protein n=1 Tax=Rubus argutus TaxID=59490 RepID=A0AAW1Y7R8_RUBAR